MKNLSAQNFLYKKTAVFVFWLISSIKRGIWYAASNMSIALILQIILTLKTNSVLEKGNYLQCIIDDFFIHRIERNTYSCAMAKSKVSNAAFPIQRASFAVQVNCP